MSATTTAPATAAEAAPAQPTGEVVAWAQTVAPVTRRRPSRSLHLYQRGMATAEYAIGVLAAICVALTLAKYITGATFLDPFTKAITGYIGQLGTTIKPR